MTSPSTRMTQPRGVPAGSGLRLHVEVVELERIAPPTTVLATYEVETDEQGNVVCFRRFRRYARRTP